MTPHGIGNRNNTTKQLCNLSQLKSNGEMHHKVLTSKQSGISCTILPKTKIFKFDYNYLFLLYFSSRNLKRNSHLGPKSRPRIKYYQLSIHKTHKLLKYFTECSNIYLFIR